jgi:hypothetical protein
MNIPGRFLLPAGGAPQRGGSRTVLGEILTARILNHSDIHIPNPGNRKELDLNSRKGSRRL